MTPHKLFAPRRIGVCGSSKDLPPQAVKFCEAVGTRLAAESHVVIASGGSLRRVGEREDNLATDWHIVNAAQEAIREVAGPEQIAQRIETVAGDDYGKDVLFHIGSLRQPRGKTREARRFSFVRSLDALLAVAGRTGTAQELALAAELGMPVLPVPLFEGTAKEFWQAYRSDLIRTLRLSMATLERWQASAPDDDSQLHDLAVVLLNRAGTLGDAAVAPFDLSMHQRLEYQTVEASLVGLLVHALAELPTQQ